jgi:monothiol glutaredoxin
MTRNVLEEIAAEVQGNPVVLYMKGTKSMPQCGFSAAVVAVLTDLGVTFKDINVLADPDVREGIKRFSDWPTIPQLYVNGEFIGGCDIVRDMHSKGELASLIKNAKKS